MDCNTLGIHVAHCLLEFAQVHVHVACVIHVIASQYLTYTLWMNHYKILMAHSVIFIIQCWKHCSVFLKNHLPVTIGWYEASPIMRKRSILHNNVILWDQSYKTVENEHTINFISNITHFYGYLKKRLSTAMEILHIILYLCIFVYLLEKKSTYKVDPCI